MPIPQRIDPEAPGTAVCDMADRWQIHYQLAWGLFSMSRMLPFGISIISGYRTPERQRELLNDPDATAAPVDRSTHTSCPATGADLRPHVDVIDDQVKRAIGSAAQMVGLRWGGGARRVNGIPVGNEWRHVDLGPRSG